MNPGDRHSRFARGAATGALVLALAVALCGPEVGQAQSQPQQESEQQAAASGELQEIVVTATRRAEKLQNVPISVTAFSKAQMDIQGMRDVDDIARLAPGVQFGRGGGFGSDLGSEISIRGISSDVGGSTTAIYIDDTPIQARATLASGNFSANAYPRLFDIDRVEVLRGPQGTLFGAGAEGGAIRFITPQPSLTTYSTYARTEASYTQDGAPSYEAGVAGGGPIIPGTLGFRASVWTRHDGGYVDRDDWYTQQVLTPNSDYMDSYSARLAFGWSPVSHLLITPSVFYQRIRDNDTSAFFMPSTDPNFPQPLGNVSNHGYVNGHTVPQWADQRMTLPALKVDYSFSKMELISNTSYYERQESAQTDYSFLDFGNWTSAFSGGQVIILFPSNPRWTAPGYAPQTNRFFTQEVRLQSTDTDSRIKWVAGAYYSNDALGTTLQVHDPWLGDVLQPFYSALYPYLAASNPNLPTSCSGQDCVTDILGSPLYQGVYPYYGTTVVHDREQALFGQVDFRLTHHLTATVGARWSRLHFDFSNDLAGPVNGPVPIIDTGASNNTALTPKYMLSWRTDGGALIYASATKGFRNGGANVPVQNPACTQDLANLGLKSAPESYGPDSVWSYEIGSKLTADRRRVVIDASIYKITWNNIIQNVTLPCILSFTTNLGSAVSEGADLAVEWRVLDSLLLAVNGSYSNVHSTSTLYPKGANGNPLTNSQGEVEYYTRTGASLPGSYPTVNLSAQYSFLAGSLPSYARVDWSWEAADRKGDEWDPSSAEYAGANNLFPQPAIHQVNLRLGTDIDDWDISLFVNNLTNYQPILDEGRVIQDAPLLTATTLRPRTIGVTAVYRH